MQLLEPAVPGAHDRNGFNAGGGEREVIYVLNSIGPTSSPFNEYVLYRLRRYPDERPVVITWLPNDPEVAAMCRREPLASRLELVECHAKAATLVRALNARIARSRSADRRTVVHVHHAAAGALARCVKMAPWLPRVPTVYTMHTAYGQLSLRNRGLTAWAMTGADQSVFVSEASLDAFPIWLRGRLRAEPLVIRNGVDLERVDAVLRQLTPRYAEPVLGDPGMAAPERTARAGALSLITVGRLVDLKNQELLIRALAGLPDNICLTIVGGGPLEANLRTLATSLGLADRVRLTGVIPREEVFRELRNSDLFVSSSRWEGLPVAVLEAMACELPVLLSDIPSHREVARDLSAAKLLPSQVEAWVPAIRAFAETPDTERLRLGASARAAVRESFSLERMQASYRTVYERLWSYETSEVTT